MNDGGFSIAGVPLFPIQASSIAAQLDLLTLFLVAVTLFFSALIFLLVIVFAIVFRRKSESDTPKPHHGDMRLEILWIVVPLGISLVAFFWGAELYFRMARPPENAMEVYGVGKQWMWKFQHPDGQREINDLHVPLGVPMKVTLTSEDVIHAFYVPAFRVKMDVVPGRYTSAWFMPTKTGRFHLYCAEYCGMNHSRMGGFVTVMEPAEYARWLREKQIDQATSVAAASGNKSASAAPASMSAKGRQIVERLRCSACHGLGASVSAPPLEGLFGKQVKLTDGRTVAADERYLREAILRPNDKIVAGYQSNMPTFEGLLSEEEVLQIITYIKSLKDYSETGI